MFYEHHRSVILYLLISHWFVSIKMLQRSPWMLCVLTTFSVSSHTEAFICEYDGECVHAAHRTHTHTYTHTCFASSSTTTTEENYFWTSKTAFSAPSVVFDHHLTLFALLSILLSLSISLSFSLLFFLFPCLLPSASQHKWKSLWLGWQWYNGGSSLPPAFLHRLLQLLKNNLSHLLFFDLLISWYFHCYPWILPPSLLSNLNSALLLHLYCRFCSRPHHLF